MNTNKILYHTSKTARYWKYSNGAIEKEYFGKDPKEKQTNKCSVSNDPDGWFLIDTCLKQIGIIRKRYRCPKDGVKYSKFCYGLKKDEGKVIDIYFQPKQTNR